MYDILLGAAALGFFRLPLMGRGEFGGFVSDGFGEGGDNVVGGILCGFLASGFSCLLVALRALTVEGGFFRSEFCGRSSLLCLDLDDGLRLR